MSTADYKHQTEWLGKRLHISHNLSTTRPSSASLVKFYDMIDKLRDVIDSDRFLACGDFNCGGPAVSAQLQFLLT